MGIIKRIINRYKNRDKWAYFMNIAFGLCLLMITLQFQFAKTTIIISDPPAIIKLSSGYITERHLYIRIIEGIIGLGIISLGIERIKNGRKGND